MNSLAIVFLLIGLLGLNRRQNDKVIESLIEFRIDNAGIEVIGVIERVKAQVNFSGENPQESWIIAKANPIDIRTGIPIRDKHLQKSDYFHTDRYPEITLSSTSFKNVGKRKFEGTFLLTIKDVKEVITIPFAIEHQGNTIVYSGAFEINRLDFGLGEQSLVLDNFVKVFLIARVQKR